MILSDYLFVYGTLQSTYKNEWSNFLQTHASFVSNAWFFGSLYLIDFYPGAVYDQLSDSKVFGELYYSKNIECILNKLDVYEGCHENDPLPHEFRKEIIPVFTDHDTIRSWCYLFNFSTEDFPKLYKGKFQ